MADEIKVQLIKLGSDLISHAAKLGIQRALSAPPAPRRLPPDESKAAPALPDEQPVYHDQAASIPRPTTEQTVQALRRRLGGELYDLELDIQDGLKIAGLPCDCFQEKHGPAIQRIARELMPMDPQNPTYSELSQWVGDKAAKATPEAVMAGTYQKEYPDWMSQARAYRKAIMGTLAVSSVLPEEKSMKFEKAWKAIEEQGKQPPKPAITLEEAQEMAADEARKEVQRIWTAQKQNK